ncbi:MAG: hypothetical protein NW241_07475 [Bacteroidia bacterium]|nr:hypothetical protein [Bacteroidia bacterium]
MRLRTSARRAMTAGCLLLAAALAACSGGASQENRLRRQLESQIQRACAQMQAYERQVTDYPAGKPPAAETVRHLPDSAGSLYQLLDDVLAAGDLDAQDPYLLESMDLRTAGDTLIAAVKSPGAADLALQKRVYQPGSDSLLRYLESHVIKSGWLYAMDLHTRVVFDSLGRYERHETRLVTRVSAAGAEFSSAISGKAFYE